MEHVKWGLDSKYLDIQGATTAPNGWDWTDHEGFFLLGLLGAAAGFSLCLYRLYHSAKTSKVAGAEASETGLLVFLLVLFGIGKYWMEVGAVVFCLVVALSRKKFAKNGEENVALLNIRSILYGMLFLWSLWHFLGAILDSYSVHHHLMKHIDKHVRATAQMNLKQ